jgi:hypothetical protein
MERSKEPDLALLIGILSDVGLTYAVIGGVALQVHQQDPRTTLDVDVAVSDHDEIPGARLEGAGFRKTGRHAHSENWVGPEGTPVQFTDDPALRDAIGRAVEVRIGTLGLRVLRVDDLLHEKLRAGRLRDHADAQALIEQHPELERSLAPDERAQLDRLPG